jgi:hypothetical protein
MAACADIDYVLAKLTCMRQQRSSKVIVPEANMTTPKRQATDVTRPAGQRSTRIHRT